MVEPIAGLIAVGGAIGYGYSRWKRSGQITAIAERYGFDREAFSRHLEEEEKKHPYASHGEEFLENVAREAKKTIAIRDKMISEYLDKLHSELDEESKVLESLEITLTEEKAARARFKPPKVGQRYTRIVIIGNTGDGKSTVGNRLCGDTSVRGIEGPFRTTANPDSETQAVQLAFVENPSPVCVVDTPGSGDSNGPDVERAHVNGLVDFLHGINTVDAFLVVRNFKNKRLSQSDQVILQSFQRLLGEEFWRNVIFVCTNVDTADDESDFESEKGFLNERIAQHLDTARQVVRNIEMIGIGRHNYGRKIGEIFEAVERCNEGMPFSTEKLIAPVEDTQADYNAQKKKVDDLTAKIEDLEEERRKVKELEGVNRGF